MSIFKRGTVKPEAPNIPSLPEPEPDPDNREYQALWDSMVIRDSWVARAEHAARLVVAGRTRYKTVENATKVQWYLVGLLHLMESDCDFGTHLHNGDSLKQRTVHVPRGRPVQGNPPFTWEFSAQDALEYDRILPPLNTINEMLFALERYNGLGARRHGYMSAYLWSGSNHYTKGKYVRDGIWDPNFVSDQVGCCPVLRILVDQGHVRL